MSDILTESIVDKRIQQAIDFSGDSDTRLKYACIAASRIVGTYSDGTQKIAKARRRHVSTVENWAHAHWLYVSLRNDPQNQPEKKLIRTLWRTMPASHWWLAYDIYAKGYDALHYLANAGMHGWSGRDMMQEYRKDMEAGNAPMVIRRVIVTFKGLADELLDRYVFDLTFDQIAALQKVQEVFHE